MGTDYYDRDYDRCWCSSNGECWYCLKLEEHCDDCGKETENGAGHWLDELGIEDRLCTECYLERLARTTGFGQ